MKLRFSALAILVLPALLLGGCTRIKAKAAFKDGNKDYKEENFKKAIEEYKHATDLDPDMAEAWFYLGSSEQALYRPGKPDADNKAHLDRAIEAYKQSLDKNPNPSSKNLQQVKANALGALTGIYSEDPYRDYNTALGYANQLVQDNPNDAKNLYAMANLYEKFGKVPEAEKTYKQVADQNASDPKACGALAAFYNKPLWDGKSKFDEAITILQRCAALDPNDPSGWQKVATFYWDKAYRDPLLNDQQKSEYADKGLEAVDKALKIKPDYFEAVIFKGLLYRVKSNTTADARLKQQYMDRAVELGKQGVELKKQAAAEAAQAAAAAPPATTGGQ